MKRSYLKRYFSKNKIDYYTCWEDIQLIQEALKINSNDVIFSITSAGCNVLNFLLCNPRKILSVDYNPYQNFLLELKIEAIRNLDYAEFSELLGIKFSTKREEIYNSIKEHLNSENRLFWEYNINAIKKGIMYVGEQNVKVIGKQLRFLKGNETIENLFKCNTVEEQARYFYKHIYGLPWRFFLNFYFNKYLVKLELCFRLIREYPYRRERLPEYLRYIQKVSYPKNHLNKIESIFTNHPIQNNYYASLLLLGRYLNEDFFPPYLKKESFDILKERIERIQIKTSSFKEVLMNLPNNSITKFNLSNVFDWMDNKEFEQLLMEISRVGKNGSRFFYLTTRNDRSVPNYIETIQLEKQFAVQLLEKDRTMLYSNFEVGRISK